MTVTLDDLPLRDDLRGQTPYGAPQAPLAIALNVNENTHPVPPVVADDIARSVAEVVAGLNRYPDREFYDLREAFAGYLGHDLTAEQIWAANGSNEVLQHVLQAFGGPGRTAMGFTPTYSMYTLLARGVGSEWIAGTRGERFEMSPSDAARQVREANPDVVFLCSPNNPTGTPLSLDVVEAVYEASRGIVVVDEAYAEFAPAESGTALSLLPGRERLLVSRTMSKAFAFAGARVGYLAADPVVIDALRLVRLPYHLSAVTQAAALAALRHSEEMLRTVADIVLQRDRISEGVAALGYDPYRTGSNFVLFGGVADARAVWQKLYDRGVLVRDVGIPGHLRVSAGTEAETTAFLDALRDITAEEN
ncbi:histidinol-phosphate transaminase [Microbacterium amylolyticum]|uniref:Histidinol-phosphate aminotransferase n=1 Tax=Microbacterium amylolyticum TaxID=936337 RepID=A0ABS4ZFS6_9MICO|nr:histidinol-phosphate transaminase [Microbacterium amylolyticum]MBP2436132.1 histidinol-phosphate aminotransferase [Microbacterium amylolyticum]